jgi:GntR family transcriptional regulator
VDVVIAAERKRVPLWHRIELVLRHKIETGVFRGGEALPSEPILAARFGVSRMTVREAIRSLTSEGLVQQIQGKGNYVLPRGTSAAGEAMISSFVGDLKYNDAFPALNPDPVHRVPHCSVIHLERVSPPQDVRQLLELAEPTVVRVERVITHNDEPVGYVLDYLPHALGDRIDEADLAEAWLTQVLTERLGIPVVEAHQTISATLADVDLGEQLQVPFGAPLLHAERLYLGRDGQRLYVAKVWHRADRFRYGAVFHISDVAHEARPPAQARRRITNRTRAARAVRRAKGLGRAG